MLDALIFTPSAVAPTKDLRFPSWSMANIPAMSLLLTNPAPETTFPSSSNNPEAMRFMSALVTICEPSMIPPSWSKLAAAIFINFSDCSKSVLYFTARASARSVLNTSIYKYISPVNASLKSPVPFHRPEWLNTR